MKKPNMKVLFSLMLILFSCSQHDHQSPAPLTKDVSGQWELIITPDQVYLDTALIKGHRATDFDVYSAICDDLWLHQNNDQLIGFLGPCKLTGTISGNQVKLQFYDHPDGQYLPERPVEEMVHMSDLTLTLDDYQLMEGTGTYLPYAIYPEITRNTYKVKARRTAMAGKSTGSAAGIYAVTNWENDICKVIYSLASWVITDLSYGVIRPMSSNCWLHKAGGGYYVFGSLGPGSVFPILTQSIYFPFELSACQVREYGFNISLGGENISYIALKDLMTTSQPVADFIQKLGFTGIPQVEQLLDEFYQQFGGFALTLFFNTNTGSSTIYVNHSTGNDNDAINSGLVQTVKGAFGSHSSGVYIYAGTSINDTQHLRRSPAFVCNSPIVICYLFGTNNVQYN